MGDFPKVEATQNIPQLNYAQYAELLGLKGIHVERSEQVGPAQDAALSADWPVVIDALVDPNMASLPPHITYAQAKSFTKALLKGDPDGYEIVKQSIKRSWV